MISELNTVNFIKSKGNIKINSYKCKYTKQVYMYHKITVKCNNIYVYTSVHVAPILWVSQYIAYLFHIFLFLFVLNSLAMFICTVSNEQYVRQLQKKKNCASALKNGQKQADTQCLTKGAHPHIHISTHISHTHIHSGISIYKFMSIKVAGCSWILHKVSAKCFVWWEFFFFNAWYLHVVVPVVVVVWSSLFFIEFAYWFCDYIFIDGTCSKLMQYISAYIWVHVCWCVCFWYVGVSVYVCAPFYSYYLFSFF